MTDTLTDEQIEYIRAWAASGNGVRCAALDQVEVSGVQGILPDWAWEMLDEHEDTFCQLSPAGLNIASQAERNREIEAENAIFRAYLSGAVGALTDADDIPCGEFETVAKWIRQLTAERDKLREMLAQAWDDGADEALDDVPGGDEYATAICIHADAVRKRNPYRSGARND